MSRVNYGLMSTCKCVCSDMRGFMTAHGQPDQSRSARYVLKDYVGVSLYSSRVCHVQKPAVKWNKKSVLMILHIFFFFDESLQGKLLYCHPPPLINAKDFQPQHLKFINQTVKSGPSTCISKPAKVKQIENTVDKTFFHQVRSYFLWIPPPKLTFCYFCSDFHSVCCLTSRRKTSGH